MTPRYSMSINSIDAQGRVGTGDVFQGDDLELDELLAALRIALTGVTQPDPDCADAAFDLTISKHFEVVQDDRTITFTFALGEFAVLRQLVQDEIDRAYDADEADDLSADFVDIAAKLGIVPGEQS